MLQFVRRLVPGSGESLPENVEERDKRRLKQLLRHPERDGKIVDNIFIFDPKTDYWDTEFNTSLAGISLVTQDLVVAGAEEEVLHILERRVETLFRYNEGSLEACGRRQMVLQMKAWSKRNDCLIASSTVFGEIFAQHFPAIVRGHGKLAYSIHLYPMLRDAMAEGWPVSTLHFEAMMAQDDEVESMFGVILCDIDVKKMLRERISRDAHLFQTRERLQSFLQKTVLPKLVDPAYADAEGEAQRLLSDIMSLQPSNSP